eukprot:UN02406
MNIWSKKTTKIACIILLVIAYMMVVSFYALNFDRIMMTAIFGGVILFGFYLDSDSNQGNDFEIVRTLGLSFYSYLLVDRYLDIKHFLSNMKFKQKKDCYNFAVKNVYIKPYHEIVGGYFSQKRFKVSFTGVCQFGRMLAWTFVNRPTNCSCKFYVQNSKHVKHLHFYSDNKEQKTHQDKMCRNNPETTIRNYFIECHCPVRLEQFAMHNLRLLLKGLDKILNNVHPTSSFTNSVLNVQTTHSKNKLYFSWQLHIATFEGLGFSVWFLMDLLQRPDMYFCAYTNTKNPREDLSQRCIFIGT